MPHLQVASLKLYYKKDSSVVRAVDGVELAVERGETLGIVGESGCGKSSLASAIFRSFPQNVALFEGSVRLGDVDITRIGEEEFRKDYRWRRIAMVPQSSMNSLDPIYTVGKQMVETIQEHSDMSEREAKELSEGMLREVELPVEVFNRYPFQLSGGQKQRVMIALALILNPELLIADEPTTALDVVVQSKILRLLSRLSSERRMTSIYITHDMGVVSVVASRVAVMYAGRIVEVAPASELFANPLHPYTQKLISCIPRLGGKREGELKYIPGTPPSLTEGNFESCLFAPRCERVMGECSRIRPKLVRVGDEHYVACLLYG
ncbi:hypothetical protein B9Q04_09190 [Candidatus Marsarchaeota G2 archaeon BE_D]|jgi:peptide/nickel transport system ATP-binding protein|uniref:ABC transporter domain-containing protein n=1 Tax=Candidatus Marsarchaeota G2 archaeon BE_D TaxID=1978158 RepID=A0A2R6CAB7_9ARCH|nr:MAG: hypothetical protein B9Q04_09190 [Candidatus Marsarchaeota G2 archaeon BE_D]